MVIPQNIKDESIQYTQDQLDKVMQDYPRLTSFGFGSYDPKDFERDREYLRNDLAGFQAACVYLSRMKKTKSINMAVSSYGYKHRVEDMGYPYLFNGTFTAAALHMGFKLDTHPGNTDAVFYIFDPFFEEYGGC